MADDSLSRPKNFLTPDLYVGPDVNLRISIYAALTQTLEAPWHGHRAVQSNLYPRGGRLNRAYKEKEIKEIIKTGK